MKGKTVYVSKKTIDALLDHVHPEKLEGDPSWDEDRELLIEFICKLSGVRRDEYDPC